MESTVADAQRNNQLMNSFSYKYGKPLMSLILYSTLTLLTLQYASAYLEYEEYRIQKQESFARLVEERDGLRDQVEAAAKQKAKESNNDHTAATSPVKRSRGWLW
jgi:hypothetical protein